MIANLRLVLDVEVKPGTDTAACHSSPGLWELLDRLPRTQWPQFIRGDSDWGVEDVMATAEEKQLIHKHHSLGEWDYVIDGWEATDDPLKLAAWSNERRVVIESLP